MSNADSGRLSGDVPGLPDEIAELRASRRRLVDDAHEDRRAIERELHDGLQQHLAALFVDLQLLTRLGDGDAVAARALVAEMTSIVHEAVDEAARLATRIYPQILDGRGLAGALRSAASSAGITATVDVPAVVGEGPEGVLSIYRAWTDALASAPPGSAVRIKVLAVDGGLGFEILVRGQSPDAVLRRIRDQVEALDGRVGFERQPRGRLSIHGWLPLPR